MTSRDDMVITPQVGKPAKGGAKPAVSPAEKLDQAKRKRTGLLGRLAQAHAARRIGRGARRLGSAARKLSMSARAAKLGKWLLRKTVGISLTAMAFGAAVALRLKTGRPIKSTMMHINDAVLQRLDVQAKAHALVIEEFLSDPAKVNLAFRGTADNQLMKLYRQEAEERTRLLKGQRILQLEFSGEINAAFDIVVLRLTELFDETLSTSGVVTEVDRLKHQREAAQELLSTPR